MLEHPPRGVKPSNGEVERAVQTAHGLARTLKEHLEQMCRMVIDPKNPILAWLIEYSGVLHNLFNRSSDGLTPYHRLKGKPWRVPLPAFGECVEFKRRTTHKLEARWERGVYLGIKEGTVEKLVGTASGIFSIQSIRRVPEDARYDGDLIKDIRGLPWRLAPTAEERVELPMPAEILPERPEVPLSQ